MLKPEDIPKIRGSVAASASALGIHPFDVIEMIATLLDEKDRKPFTEAIRGEFVANSETYPWRL